jgi:formate hydrogenlyase transcriptional activator
LVLFGYWYGMTSSRHFPGTIAPSEESPDTATVRLEFETLISDLSARFVNVPAEQVDAEISDVLRRVCEHLDLDLAALWQWSSEASPPAFRATHYYVIQHGPQAPELLQQDDYPWFAKEMSYGRNVVVSSVENLPGEASRDRESCLKLGIKSNLTIPISVGGEDAIGILGLNTTRAERDWPDELVKRLQLVAQIFANALARKRNEQALRASEKLSRKQATRVAAAVDAAELGFSEWSPETEEPFFDDRLCELLGIRRGDLAKAKELWLSRMDPESKSIVVTSQRQILDGEVERATTEYWYDHPQRGRIWLRHSSRRLEGELGTGPRIVEAVEDVTERRQALEDLQRLRERLESENVYLRQEAKKRLGSDAIIGRSNAILRTLEMAEQVATTNSTVLLLGETGSGKGRFASYIHECSQRRDRHMITVNCSAIPSSLIESELFGREKGAYTGALSKQVGRFELAHGSTIFIDEIGDLPLEMQVKFLRVLDSHTIERLGNPKPISVDVRIIAATNRDLASEVRNGRFRQDLYYRLNVFPIAVPPLRERRQDIPLFVSTFIREFAGTMAKPVKQVDPSSLEALAAYSWPGNVRELRNVVERAMIMTNGPTLLIPLPGMDAIRLGNTDLDAIQRAHIEKILHETGWRIRGPHGAAARLGLNPTTLESRLKSLGLKRPGI